MHSLSNAFNYDYVFAVWYENKDSTEINNHRNEREFYRSFIDACKRRFSLNSMIKMINMKIYI